ncbi:MAG: hypothetical protein ACP5RP_00455 [Candidatus Micrarchaeia archaeon]
MLKAQFWSIDIIFAIAIFGIVLTLLALAWHGISTQEAIGYDSQAVPMQINLQAVAQLLMSTGYPPDWPSTINISNASSWYNTSIGLSTNYSGISISSEKLLTFMEMASYNYSMSKRALDTPYNYYITIKSDTNSGNIFIKIGKAPKSALTSYTTEEAGILNGIPVMIQITLWENLPIAVS